MAALGRTRIILFTDLVGSTALRTQLGDVEYDRRRHEHDRILRDAIERYDGILVKHEGDGIMASFESAADAMSCAVAMQQSLWQIGALYDARLSMRVGISAGDVADEDGDYHGTPVVEAARLCATAQGGQILVADVVRVLAGTRAAHSLASVGELELKGLRTPLATWEVPWAPAEHGALLPVRLAEVAARGACVGREAEMARLVDEWQRVATGERRLVLIVGEPGVGKTRLAAAIAEQVAPSSVLVHGGCDEDLGAAYQPWVPALRAFFRACADDEVAEVRAAALEVARLVPDLEARLGESSPPAIDPQTDRARLFDAVDLVLSNRASRQPVVVVLDDLHWADQPTLALLRWILRSDRAGALLLIGTYRDTDIDRRHPFGKLLADLRRETRVSRIPLRGLDEEGVACLLADRAGHEAPKDFVTRMYEETEGNPFFTEEVLAHLVESGAIFQRDGQWTSDMSVEELGLPEGVRDVIGRRLLRLPEATNETLEIAAVVGREFDVRTVAAVNEFDAATVLDAIEPALAASLVTQVAGAQSQLAFSHALVRQTLLEEITTPRRARLNWRVGQTLARSGTESSAVVAKHLCEGVLAGDPVVASAATVAAAEDAVAIAAAEEARRFAEQACAVLADAGLDEPELRARALLVLGESSVTDAQNIAAARDDLAEAGRLAIDLGRPDLAARAAIYYSFSISPGAADPAGSELAAAALDLGPSPEWRPVVQALAGRFDILVDEPRGLALVAEAMTHVRSCTPLGQLIVLMTFVQGVFGAPDLEAVTAVLDELPATADLAGSALWSVSVARSRAALAMRTGDRSQLDQEMARLEELERRIAGPAIEHTTMEMAVALLDGRFAEVQTMAFGLIAVLDAESSEYVNVLGQLAATLYWTGRDDELLTGLDGFATDVRAQRIFVDLVRSSVLARRGERHPTYVALAEQQFAELPNNWTRPGCLAQAGATAAMLDDRDAAARVEGLVDPYRDQIFVLPGGAVAFDVADSVRGMLLTTLGRADEAVECHERASALCARAQSVIHAVMNDHRLAAALAARGSAGDLDRARALAEGARDRATALGMSPDAGAAQKVLDRL